MSFFLLQSFFVRILLQKLNFLHFWDRFNRNKGIFLYPLCGQLLFDSLWRNFQQFRHFLNGFFVFQLSRNNSHWRCRTFSCQNTSVSVLNFSPLCLSGRYSDLIWRGQVGKDQRIIPNQLIGIFFLHEKRLVFKADFSCSRIKSSFIKHLRFLLVIGSNADSHISDFNSLINSRIAFYEILPADIPGHFNMNHIVHLLIFLCRNMVHILRQKFLRHLPLTFLFERSCNKYPRYKCGNPGCHNENP